MRSKQTGDGVGRPGRESSLSGAPGAKCFYGKPVIGTKKEKRSKKERNGGLWELTPLMGIRSQRGFPQRLGKHKTLSTVPTRPDGGSITGFERQRSTLKHAFLWSEGRRAPQTIKRQVCQFQLSQQRGSPQPGVPKICQPVTYTRTSVAEAEKPSNETCSAIGTASPVSSSRRVSNGWAINVPTLTVFVTPRTKSRYPT